MRHKPSKPAIRTFSDQGQGPQWVYQHYANSLGLMAKPSWKSVATYHYDGLARLVLVNPCREGLAIANTTISAGYTKGSWARGPIVDPGGRPSPGGRKDTTEVSRFSKHDENNRIPQVIFAS
ncbi:MAG: hypothetical protein IPJ00_11015 [Saprospirales bacterium]|nr:hypothetical protein [Saprospirales bacterium]